MAEFSVPPAAPPERRLDDLPPEMRTLLGHFKDPVVGHRMLFLLPWPSLMIVKITVRLMCTNALMERGVRRLIGDDIKRVVPRSSAGAELMANVSDDDTLELYWQALRQAAASLPPECLRAFGVPAGAPAKFGMVVVHTFVMMVAEGDTIEENLPNVRHSPESLDKVIEAVCREAPNIRLMANLQYMREQRAYRLSYRVATRTGGRRKMLLRKAILAIWAVCCTYDGMTVEAASKALSRPLGALFGTDQEKHLGQEMRDALRRFGLTRPVDVEKTERISALIHQHGLLADSPVPRLVRECFEMPARLEGDDG